MVTSTGLVDETPRPVRKRKLYAASAAAFRWVHIYFSMFGFATLMFFAFTGITLNHPTWFGAGEQTMRDLDGQIPDSVIGIVVESPSGPQDDESELNITVDELAIAEWLRAEHHLKGRVTEFEVDEFECMIVFKGPGYAADIFLDHETGDYMLTETASGLMAVMNDLHKGRDTGAEWSLVIDISAILTMLLSISGFGLLFYLRRRRLSGVITAFAGTIVLVAAWAIWVP
ncbi:PepSY-associated TM helix domain-containing protein [Thalassoglobus sp. JC818]|uniref:PepSY-associated TM helix domain-containing protein n=1 Tax=Thalassoglobus sp. JC818 TaxID=3232136 RepID=UPI00345AFE03